MSKLLVLETLYGFLEKAGVNVDQIVDMETDFFLDSKIVKIYVKDYPSNFPKGKLTKWIGQDGDTNYYLKDKENY
jgi:hypothetical protein